LRRRKHCDKLPPGHVLLSSIIYFCTPGCELQQSNDGELKGKLDGRRGESCLGPKSRSDPIHSTSTLRSNMIVISKKDWGGGTLLPGMSINDARSGQLDHARYEAAQISAVVRSPANEPLQPENSDPRSWHHLRRYPLAFLRL
jgi:hypothetical protein